MSAKSGTIAEQEVRRSFKEKKADSGKSVSIQVLQGTRIPSCEFVFGEASTSLRVQDALALSLTAFNKGGYQRVSGGGTT